MGAAEDPDPAAQREASDPDRRARPRWDRHALPVEPLDQRAAAYPRADLDHTVGDRHRRHRRHGDHDAARGRVPATPDSDLEPTVAREGDHRGDLLRPCAARHRRHDPVDASDEGTVSRVEPGRTRP
jgi:hypothetical protein